MELDESGIPAELSNKIIRDYIFQISSLLRNNPGYLSGLILDLDRLMDRPEDERQELFKQILSSIQKNVGDTEDKIIII